jgi:hypothetical protein
LCELSGGHQFLRVGDSISTTARGRASRSGWNIRRATRTVPAAISKVTEQENESGRVEYHPWGGKLR